MSLITLISILVLYKQLVEGLLEQLVEGPFEKGGGDCKKKSTYFQVSGGKGFLSGNMGILRWENSNLFQSHDDPKA